MPALATLHFPSESSIIAYIEQDPYITNLDKRYFAEKRITQTVAKHFANQDFAPGGVDLGVMLVTYDLNKSLHLPEHTLYAIQENLKQVLRDCGSTKFTLEEKIDR